MGYRARGSDTGTGFGQRTVIQAPEERLRARRAGTRGKRKEKTRTLGLCLLSDGGGGWWKGGGRWEENEGRGSRLFLAAPESVAGCKSVSVFYDMRDYLYFVDCKEDISA